MSANVKDSILYELFVYAEWRPDPDFIRGEIIPKRSSGSSSLGYFLKYIKPERTLVENISSYINQLQPWQICLGDDGKVVAVLQDSVLEIRTKRANYSTIVARAGVPRDPNPQWRKMVWSPDCSMLAIAHSNGKVSFYDLMATNLFNIAPDCSQPPEFQCMDTTHAVSGIIFITSRVTDRKWSSELLLVDYRGVLRSFFVSPTDEYIFNHKFSFEGGVSTITYHSSHNIIFVSGLPSTQGKNFGLRAWRLLNDNPFYKLCISLEKEAPISFTSLFTNYFVPQWNKNHQSVITRAVPSPDGRTLVCLHMDGSVSLWQLPTLRFMKLWPLTSQPNFDLKSSLVSNSKHKVWPPLENEISEYSPIDVNWWNTETVIISRLNGSISICSTEDLHNKLGDNPEFLQGHPQISCTFDNGFLSLECEAILVSAKKLRQDSDSNDDTSNTVKDGENESTGDSSDEEKMSITSRSREVVKTALYIITDMERFQPKPKKLNLLSRVYRLLCLRSTTPEDLYLRKIENGDFVEALALANTYNLDSDLVYQQQWRTSKVSHQSIQGYLGKVYKKIWVIQQCCNRVPETLPAAKELLEFGLELSNSEILKDITEEHEDISKHKEILNKLTSDDLSSQKLEILRCRHTMLFYLDRLEIYKAIIQSEFSSYSSDEYDRLRSNTISKSAVEFARDGRVQALKCLYPHLNNIESHLLVLQNLPETLDPVEYKFLLPSFNSKINLIGTKSSLRETDWCENEIFRSIWNNLWKEDIISPEDNECISNDSDISLSTNLTEWYTNRAREIETLSGLSNYALKLIVYAQEGNVLGLEELKCLLITLNTLIYDVNVENMSLLRLEGCSQSQVCNYLMSKSNEDTIIHDINHLLYPYLERCQKLSDNKFVKELLFKEYVVNIGKKDLHLPIVILQNSSNLDLSTKQCLDLVSSCFMAQDSLTQIDLCFKMLDALPKESDDSVVPSYFVRVLDELERHLNACALLQSHNVCILFSNMKSIATNPQEVVSILSEMAHNAANSSPSLTSEEWNELLADILNLHSKVFCCIDIELCFEIYASSLLSSSNKVNIQSARQVLTCHQDKDQSSPTEKYPNILKGSSSSNKIPISQKIPFDKSVTLVLKAAIDYFNSASSLSDVCLVYSWSCLQLIKQENVTIQHEKDLLSALKIIEEFDLKILPIQVRTLTPKIGIIEECLNCNNRTHKSVDKFLHLAKLLHISDDDDKKREVIIVSLCAEKAADNKDFDSCRTLCRRLVTVASNAGPGASEGERAARRLGSESRILDPLIRRELLNLALLYSHAQYIENLIQIRSFVEAEMLQFEMNNLVNLTSKFYTKQVNLQDSIESTDDDYVDALTSPMNENKSIMSATHVMEKYLHKPLMALGDKTWKEALNMNWLTEKKEPEINDVKYHCLDESKISCHAFYSSLHRDCHISSFSTRYDKFSTPDIPDKHLVFLQALLRNNLLQDCVSYGCSDVKPNEVLIQCAEQMLMEDTALFISQLLSISNYSMYKEFFSRTPLDSRTINSLLYFYALLNYMEMHNLPDGSFFISPAQLINDIYQAISPLEEGFLNPSKKAFLNCKERYVELLEGEKLNLMGCDIDVALFISDDEYRKTIILNLANSTNQESFQKASDLAAKYNIKQYEVSLTHMIHVLKNCNNIALKERDRIVSDQNLLNTLKINSTATLERINEEVWDDIDGKDFQKLIFYFNTMNNIASNYSLFGLNTKEHIKLIKKVKSACADLNYKYLLTSSNSEDFVEYLIPYLTTDNIGVVAKLLRNLPACLNVNFNTSKLYQKWLLKHFYNVPENLQFSKKWMQQYRECSGYFNKLKKEDMLFLANEIVFGVASLEKVPANTRIQIAHQTAEYCQHEQNNEENKLQTVKDDKTWVDIGNEISAWGLFLEKFHSEIVHRILQNCTNNKEMLRSLEKSQGDEEQLQKSFCILLCDMSLSTIDFKNVIEILSNDSLTLNDVLLATLEHSNINGSILGSITKRTLDMKMESLEINQDVLTKLKPYGSSTLLSSKQRLDLMSLFKTASDFEDIKMMSHITIESILNAWNHQDFDYIKDLNLADDEIRSKLFIKLLKLELSWNKLKILVDLINMWPSLPSQYEPSENPCLCLIIKLLKNKDFIDDNIPLLKLLLEKNEISEEDIAWISSDENSCFIVGKIWLCLLCNHESAQNKLLLSIILKEKENGYEDYIDDNLICIILNRQLFTLLVKTNLYAKCVQYLLKNVSSESSDKCVYTLNMAIDDLSEKKYIAEAGALRLAASGVPHALRSFSQAIKVHRV